MCAIFRDCRLRGVGVVRGVSLPSPIDITCRPYNTGHTTVWPCDMRRRSYFHCFLALLLIVDYWSRSCWLCYCTTRWFKQWWFKFLRSWGHWIRLCTNCLWQRGLTCQYVRYCVLSIIWKQLVRWLQLQVWRISNAVWVNGVVAVIGCASAALH